MTVLSPRVRTVGIRLSQDEYSALVRLCRKSRARSISDLARGAVMALVNGVGEESALISSVSQNAARMLELEQRLERLTRELADFRAGSRKKPDTAQ